jgi:hypothetical protein
MRNFTIKIFVVMVFLSVFVSGQTKFTPSLYYTYGDYSNQNYSNSFAGYATLAIKNSDFITGAFEQLKINNDEWAYNQTMLTAGYTKAIYPFYIKLNYSHVMGGLDYVRIPFTPTDFLNVYNTNFIYNYYLFYFGTSFIYQDVNGLKSVVTKQFKFNIDWIASSKITFSISPLYTTVTDGRSLTSVYSKLKYTPVKLLTITIGAMAGKRAYYFDENLLTIFNQDETQKKLYGARVEFNLTEQFKLPIVVQYSEFETYDIKYFTAGVVFKF